MNGKGDRNRTSDIGRYQQNFDAIFSKPDEKEVRSDIRNLQIALAKIDSLKINSGNRASNIKAVINKMINDLEKNL